MKITRATVTKALKIIAFSLVIGLAVGYFSFYITMPSVAIPTTKNPSLEVVGLTLFLLGVLVGALSDDLESTVIESLAGLILGALIGYLLFISPTFSPALDLPFAENYIFYTVRSAMPVLLLGGVVLFIGGFLGTILGEHMAIRSAKSPFDGDQTASAK